jgi:methylglutaconyl-CoA hydratase
MMATYTQLAINYDFEDRIAIVRLNRPEVRNALNARLIDELAGIFTELSVDERLHGVVLTGEGSAFCAGADIAMMREYGTFSQQQNVEDAQKLADMLERINTFPCPVVARINGHALGGGVGLVAVCDIAIAVEEARFAFSEVKLGIAPAVISPYVVRKIGESYARALFTTGERFSARRAHNIGLVHSVVPEGHLDDAVQNALQELLSSGPNAARACKALALNVGRMGREEARKYTVETIANLRVGEEGQEGLSAFLEKRAARWTRS